MSDGCEGGTGGDGCHSGPQGWPCRSCVNQTSSRLLSLMVSGSSCATCHGYYGSANGQPVCPTCHAFLYANDVDVEANAQKRGVKVCLATRTTRTTPETTSPMSTEVHRQDSPLQVPPPPDPGVLDGNQGGNAQVQPGIPEQQAAATAGDRVNEEEVQIIASSQPSDEPQPRGPPDINQPQ